jgi:hypothetical protein
VTRRLATGGLLFPGLLALAVSHCRPGNERPALCPPPESQGDLLSVRSAWQNLAAGV